MGVGVPPHLSVILVRLGREETVKRPAHLSPGLLVAQTLAPKLTCVEVPSQSTDEGEGT